MKHFSYKYNKSQLSATSIDLVIESWRDQVGPQILQSETGNLEMYIGLIGVLNQVLQWTMNKIDER